MSTEIDKKNVEEIESTKTEDEMDQKMSRWGFNMTSWMKYWFNLNQEEKEFNPVWLSIDEYKRLANEGMRQAFAVTCIKGWSVEKKSKNDVVESMFTEKYGKVYRFTGIVDCPPKFLFDEFRDNLTKLPEWNPTILKNEIIKEIGPGYDLSYQVTAGGGGGVIAPRDFVILRRCCGVDPQGEPTESEPFAYICSGISVEVPGYPPVKNMVRGENKVGCWLIKPVQVKSSSTGNIETRTNFQWLMCCDLKGKVPKWVLDKAFSTVMLEYIVHVRQLAAKSKQEGRF